MGSAKGGQRSEHDDQAVQSEAAEGGRGQLRGWGEEDRARIDPHAEGCAALASVDAQSILASTLSLPAYSWSLPELLLIRCDAVSTRRHERAQVGEGLRTQLSHGQGGSAQLQADHHA